MNLHVNLILDSERRSASAFNLRAVLRVLSIVGPATVILIALLIGIRLFQVRLEFERMENDWAAAKPRKAQAEELRARMNANQKVLQQLNAIATSRRTWHDQLITLARVTPPDIQLRRLTVGQTLHADAAKKPVRTYRMTLEGSALGDRADQSVSLLRSRLLGSTPPTAAVETANIVLYEIDPATSPDPNERAFRFRIECTFPSQRFE